jgi:hypothetical protein
MPRPRSNFDLKPDSIIPEAPEKTETAPQTSSTVIQHVLTETDSQLNKLAEQPAFDWDKAIQAVSMLDDYSILQDPFEIPPECKARYAANEFRYRWLDPGDKDRFLMQTSGRFPWVLCNRNNAPYIPDTYRDENGLVKRAGMVLAVMRYDLYMARQTRVWKLSESHADRREVKKEGYELTGIEGGKIKSGDVIVSEERYDERSKRTWMADVNQVASGDRE